MECLLKLENVSIEAESNTKNLRITDNVSVLVNKGQTVGIIGESGCGKSITALSILGLTNSNIKVREGNIFFGDVCLNKLPPKELRSICGKKIGMVFQEPSTALNPVFTIEQQLSAPMKNNLHMSKEEIKARCLELLKDVGIKEPERVLKCYPHQLSGGMCQRVVIALSISCNPQLLIADEPTTALDVTIQLQILHIIKRLVRENNMSLLIISHDMGVISMLSERICVMYGGEILEEDSRENIMNSPMHPYSKMLITAAKELNDGCKELSILSGNVPRPEDEIKGCKFAQRCEFCHDRCLQERPPLIKKEYGEGYVKCWNYVKD